MQAQAAVETFQYPTTNPMTTSKNSMQAQAAVETPLFNDGINDFQFVKTQCKPKRLLRPSVQSICFSCSFPIVKTQCKPKRPFLLRNKSRQNSDSCFEKNSTGHTKELILYLVIPMITAIISWRIKYLIQGGPYAAIAYLNFISRTWFP